MDPLLAKRKEFLPQRTWFAMLQPGLPVQEKTNELFSITDNGNAGHLGRSPGWHGGIRRRDNEEFGRQN
jgi:hypothetical protein